MAKQKRRFCKPKEAHLKAEMGTFENEKRLIRNRISLFFYLSLSIAGFRTAGHLHYRPLVPEGKEP